MSVWPSRITSSYDWRLGDYWRQPYLDAIDTINNVTGYTVTEVPLGGVWVVSVREDVLALPGVPAGWSPLALNVTYGTVASYTGLPVDPSAIEAAGWPPYAVVLHEKSHALGFTDQPLADGNASLFGYADPHPLGFTAADIEFAQARHGVDQGDSRIEVQGTAGGTISGGAGRDSITGADGADRIYGNQGDDRLVGGGNADTMFGGQDADVLSGGDGSDLLYGNLANDVLSGGAGADTMYGGQGADTLFGDEFDVLFGNLGPDVFVTNHPETVRDLGEDDVIVPLLGRNIPDNPDWMGV